MQPFYYVLLCTAAAQIVTVGAQTPAVFIANTSSGLLLSVYNDDSYSLGPHDGAWLSSAATGFHSNNTWYLTNATAAHACEPIVDTDCLVNGRTSYTGHTSGVVTHGIAPLVRKSAMAVNGSDTLLGDWKGWAITYNGGGTSFSTIFKFYAVEDAIVFEHSFPLGVTLLNLTFPVNATGAQVSEFASSLAPSTVFPSWVSANGVDAGALGSATWAGRFAGAQSSPAGGAAGALARCGGAEGGPIVMWAPQNSAAVPGAALILTPLSNFKGTIMGTAISAGGLCATGINGYALDANSNLTVATLAVFSVHGVTDVVHAMGATLQRAHKTHKISDPASTSLTFWTDNGAYYDFYSYEPDIDSKGVVQDVLVAVSETFRNGTYAGHPLPVQSIMLDAYWMYNTRANGNCKMNDSFWLAPFPRPTTLSAELQTSLILYNGPQCGNASYTSEWPSVYSVAWDQGWGAGVLSAVAGDSSELHYASIFAEMRSINNVISFTQDFLDFQDLLFPTWLEDARGNDAWQSGQAAAALAINMPIQYCMALPVDLLNSVRLDAVTNARASQDYGAGSGSSWRIAGTSLLLSALGLRASKDNFWSGSRLTDRGREPSPFLSGVVTALSLGPVGFADKIGYADPSVLWPTMMLNGTLLHMSRPATVLDVVWTGGSLLEDVDARGAHSNVSGFFFYAVLVADFPTLMPAALRMRDLWPSPPTTTSTYVVHQFNNSACVRGGSTTSCTAPIGSAGTALQPAVPSTDETQWSLWYSSPVFSNGYVLLGERGKYARVSPDRFANIIINTNGFDIKLIGTSGEVVSIDYLDGGATVRGIDVVIGADGIATVHCE